MNIEDIVGNDVKKRTKALETLYVSNFPQIEYFVLRNNGTHEDALDIFQEGIISLYENLKKGKFNYESNVKTYLYGICKNKWHQKCRQKTKERVFFTEKFSQKEKSSEFNDELLLGVLSDLEAECKKILIAFYYDKMSMRQLKELFNLGSEQAAKNKKFRCLRYLTNLVQKRGMNYSNFLKRNEE